MPQASEYSATALHAFYAIFFTVPQQQIQNIVYFEAFEVPAFTKLSVLRRLFRATSAHIPAGAPEAAVLLVQAYLNHRRLFGG